MPRSPQDVYARWLSSPRGYPLWTPEPSNELLMERRDGLRIGDVGVVIPDDGGFDVFFNICLPRDHPFHRRYGVPEGFTCIDQSELDIRTIPNADNPGRIISSSSVTRIGPAESSSDAPQRDESSPLTYRFSLSSSEGALLILPKGAERYDLLNDGLFLEQASRHGAEWYNYAVNRRHRIISHDSLYLITGIYKTRSWSVAAFENATGNQHYTAHFKQIEGDGSTQRYSWETTRALDWRIGPYVDHGIPNQAVFIRGFKIALRSGLLGTRWISVEADVPSTRSNPAKWSSIVPSNSRLLDNLARLTRNRGNTVSQTTLHNEGAADPSEELPPSDVSSHGGYDGMHVQIQRIPDVPPAFHPSDAINRYLLRKDPSANIAITHDSDWISILEDGLLTPNELAQESRLETVLSQNYRVASREGVLHLESKGKSDRLDENMLYATIETDSEEADKRSPPINMSKMDSQMKADPQHMRSVASRIVSFALTAMGQDAGLREIDAILHNMVRFENASLNMTTPLPLVLRGHTGTTTSVAFLPGGDRILSASEDGTVRSWSIPDSDQKVIEGALVLATAISSDGRRVATGGTDGMVRVWDILMSEEMISQSTGSNFSAVRSLSFSPDSSRVASGAQDGSVSVWNATTEEQMAGPFREHVNYICGICYAPDGRRIASCDGAMILIWEDDFDIRPPIIEEGWSLAWSADGDGLFVGCKDGSIKYFDPSSGVLLAVWVCHSDTILSIALSHNGKFFASASRDSTVRLWETATRYQVGATLRHSSPVHSIAISLDDRQLVSGAWDSCVRLWDLRKNAPSLFEDMSLTSDPASLQSTDTCSPLTSGPKPTILKDLGWQKRSQPKSSVNATPIPFDKGNEEKSSRDLELDRIRLAPLLAKGNPISTFSAKPAESCPPAPRRGDETTTNDKKPTTARNIYGIPPDLPPYLTDVVKDDHRPPLFNRTGSIYQGTLHASSRPIRVGIKVTTGPLAQGNSAFNKKQIFRGILDLRKLDHNNLLPLLGIIRVESSPALVFPWVENNTLTTYLRHNNNLTTASRLVLINDVAMGLQYLHSQSVVHGSLADSSVLIRANGRACIADSGLLPLMAELHGLPIAKMYTGNGTRRWVAPELLNPNEGNVSVVGPTPESDVYSFGGIMWEALTGELPAPFLSVARNRYRNSRRITYLPAGMTDDQQTFILRCWRAVGIRQPQPSATEIIEFLKEQLIKAVISIQEDSRENNDVVTPGVFITGRPPPRKCVCGWISNGQLCNTQVLEDELAAHLCAVHRVHVIRRLTCLWDNCGEELDRGSLITHVQRKHLMSGGSVPSGWVKIESGGLRLPVV